MYNITEGLWESRLKTPWPTTREGRGQRRGEETMVTLGYRGGLKEGGQKAVEYKNNFLCS